MFRIFRHFKPATRRTIVELGYTYPGGINPQTSRCILGDCLAIECGSHGIPATPGPTTVADRLVLDVDWQSPEDLRGRHADWWRMHDEADRAMAANDSGRFATPEAVARAVGVPVVAQGDSR